MLIQYPLEKIFKNALKNGGEFADLFWESTSQTAINFDNNKIEKISTGMDAGIGLRVIHHGNTAYGFTNNLSHENLLNLATSVSQAVKSKVWDLNIKFKQVEPKINFNIELMPDSIPLHRKINLLKESNKAAWKYDEKIKQVSLMYKDMTRKIAVANSSGELIEDEKIDSIFLAHILATDGKIIQTGYEPIGGFAGFEFFNGNQHEHVVKSACKRALMMLTARPAPAGTMPVILSSEAGGTMVHEAVGHGLEADLAAGGFSVYGNKIGEKVASNLVTVIDDATIPGRRGSFAFDDEGIHSQKTVLIERGILKSYMYDRISAKKADRLSTGNGRRESYRWRPVVRMTNTIIEPGKSDPESIVKETQSGLFVRKMGGGQVNTITGDFVFEVQEGYLIKNGLVCDPVRGATLSGNGPEVLKIIDRIGSDLGFAIGTCGKDSQGVPVGDAQPTLRIPQLVVGGTAL